MDEQRMPKCEVYEDRRGEWRWRVIAPNSQVVATSGEGYASEQGAMHAAFRLRDYVLSTNSDNWIMERG